MPRSSIQRYSPEWGGRRYSPRHRPRPGGPPPPGVAQPVLAAELLAVTGGVLPERLRALAVVRMGGRGEGHADAGRPAREALPRLVDERHVALGVGHPHERRRGVGQLAELGLAVDDEVLVPRAVDRGAEHAGETVEEDR